MILEDTQGALGTLALGLTRRETEPNFRECLKDGIDRKAVVLRLHVWGDSWTEQRKTEVLQWLGRFARAFSTILVLPATALRAAIEMANDWWAGPSGALFMQSVAQRLAEVQYRGELTLVMPESNASEALDSLLGQVADLTVSGRLSARLAFVFGFLNFSLNMRLFDKLARVKTLRSIEVQAVAMSTDKDWRRSFPDAFESPAFCPPPTLTRLILGTDEPLDGNGFNLAALKRLNNLQVLGWMADCRPKGLDVFESLSRLQELELGSFDASLAAPELAHLSALTALSTLRLGVRRVFTIPDPNDPKRRVLNLQAIPPLRLPGLVVMVLVCRLRDEYTRVRRAFYDPLKTFAGCPLLEEFGLRIEYTHYINFRPGSHLTVDLDRALAALPRLKGLHASAHGTRIVYRLTALPAHTNLEALIVSGWAGAEIFGLSNTLGGPRGKEFELRTSPKGSSAPAFAVGAVAGLRMAQARCLGEVAMLDWPATHRVGVQQFQPGHPQPDDEDEDDEPQLSGDEAGTDDGDELAFTDDEGEEDDELEDLDSEGDVDDLDIDDEGWQQIPAGLIAGPVDGPGLGAGPANVVEGDEEDEVVIIVE